MSEIYDQYLAIKQQHPNSIVLFRVGDFCNTFGDDAKVLSEIVDIVLVAYRNNPGIVISGVPWARKDDLLQRLIESGYKVVVCEEIKNFIGSAEKLVTPERII